MCVTNAVASTGWTLHFLTQQLRDAALSGTTALLSWSRDPGFFHFIGSALPESLLFL